MIEALPDAVLQFVVTAAATWGAVKVELRWLRRDIDRAHDRLDKVDDRIANLKGQRA